MRAITLRRPWAGAIAHLGKRVENRSRPCPGLVGELVAIHAGQGLDQCPLDRMREDYGGAADLTATGIVAVARVVGWIDEREPGELRYGGIDEVRAHNVLLNPWYCGPCGWVLDEVRALATPVPCRGALGVWRLPPDVEAVVLAQLGRRA